MTAGILKTTEGNFLSIWQAYWGEKTGNIIGWDFYYI